MLLTSLVNASSHTKCVSLSNQKCEIQHDLTNLHPNKYSQELHYYPFVVNLDKRVGSRNTLNDSSNKVSIPNKTEDLNIHFLIWLQENLNNLNIYHANVNVNLIEEDVIQMKNGIKVNVDANVKNIIYVKKIIFRILLNAFVKMINI